MGGQEIDDKIIDRFGDAWNKAARGEFDGWTENADGALALIILLDQFPRNMFRGSGKSFATDALARKVADRAIGDGHDMRMTEKQRLFIYMPFMHSEELAEQDRCIELIGERMPETGATNLLHARAHRGNHRDVRTISLPQRRARPCQHARRGRVDGECRLPGLRPATRGGRPGLTSWQD